MSNFIKYRYKLLIEILILVIIAFYAAYFNSTTLSIDKSDYSVGSMDSTSYVRPLDDSLQGKVPYKDFYPIYGPLFTYVQLPTYMLLGQNHNAFIETKCIYLPLISIILSFFWGAIFFPTSFFRILFVLICIFQNANTYDISFRHLVAEIAIGVFVLSTRKMDKKSLIFLAGLLTAAAILTSQEYGFVSFATIVIATLILYLSPHKVQFWRRSFYYLLGIGALLMPFYAYLALNGVFTHHLKYIYAFMRNFTNPASGELVPVLPTLSFKDLLSFVKSLYFFSCF